MRLCICCSLNQSDCGFEPKIMVMTFLASALVTLFICWLHTHTLNEKGAEFFVRFL